jgi:rare lipoprotein A
MRHLRNVWWGILFGCIYWLLVSLGRIGYEHLCATTTLDVFDGTVGRKAVEVKYANAVFAEIKAEKASLEMGSGSVEEQPLREDAVGLYGEISYTGKASWYGYPFDGRRTASGEIFDKSLFTAASVRHIFGTNLRVCSLGDSSHCVVVRVNDTGNFEQLGKVIDLSEAAFAEIAPLSAGVVMVKITEEK